jgi:peptide/nickel transport system permease protein
VRGDFGSSSRTGLGVGSTVLDRLPVTIELSILSMLIAIAIGLPAGVLAAVKRGKAADYAGTAGALVGQSVPHFWLGLMLILIFAIGLGVLPASGFVPFFADPLDNLRHLLMPAVVLGTGFAAVIFRQTRAAMLESLSADYVRTARAKGLSERQVLLRHVLRNSLIPVVTLWGLDFAAVLGGGAILTEKVFDLQGVGQFAADSIGQLDVPPVLAITMFGAFFIVLLSTVVDIVYAYLDPRIRLQ